MSTSSEAYLRAMVPAAMRPVSSRTWPAETTVTPGERRSVIASIGMHLQLADPVLREIVLQGAGPSKRLRGALSVNPTIPTSTRVELAGTDPHWGLLLAVSAPELTDAAVTKYLWGSAVAFDLIEDALHARPGLIDYWQTWSPSNQRTLLGSVACPEELARELVSASTRMESSIDRRVLELVAYSPVFTEALRIEAFERRTALWNAERRLSASLAFEAVPHTPWPWNNDTLAELPALEVLFLAGYASTTWGTDAAARITSREPSRLGQRALVATSRGEHALRFIGVNPLFIDMGDEGRKTVELDPEAVAALGMTQKAVIAHAVWSTSLRGHMTRRKLRPTATWILEASKTLTARSYLGTNKAAWETFVALGPGWSGTFGELLTASTHLC